MAITAEINRDSKKRSKPFAPSDFHPWQQAQAEKPRPISEMGQMFRGGLDG